MEINGKCSSSFYGFTMVEITKQLFNNQFLSDIQFYVSGKILYAHSLELMKRSPVFQKQLLLDLGENKLIPVDDVKYESFYQFIRFIYTDVYECTSAEMGIDVLKLAIKYQVTQLENKLIDWLTNEPLCLRLFEFCVMENYRLPYNRVKNKISDSLSKCLDDDSFELIHADVLGEILKLDYLNEDVTEAMLFNAVIRWINKYCVNNGISLENGLSLFRGLLELIRFSTMESNEFAACRRTMGSLFTKAEYGIINKLIAGNSQFQNSKWDSKFRFNFSWRMHHRTLEIDDNSLITNFMVTNEVLLTGIWFGMLFLDGDKKLKNVQLQLTARNFETQVTEVMKYRCYISQHFGCGLNSFGDLVLLKPNHEYTMQFIYPNENLTNSTIKSRQKSNRIIVTDPSKSVQIIKAGISIFEMIFKTPS